MSGGDIYFDTTALRDLQKAIDALGKVPQKCVTSAAAKAGTKLKRAIRGEVPVDTGTLKSGIIRVPEKSRYKGKKVYQATFDRALNSVFQKPIQNPGAAGGKWKHAYYPASQEFGFLTRSKGGGISYVKGLHFMGETTAANDAALRNEMIKNLTDNLEKEWRKTYGT